MATEPAKSAIASEPQQDHQPNTKATTAEIYVSSWNKTLLQLLFHCFELQQLCDFSIKFMTGELIKVHRIILECSCDLSCLGVLSSEDTTLLLVHHDICVQHVYAIIRFMYSGRVLACDGLQETAKLLGITSLVTALNTQRSSDTVMKSSSINDEGSARQSGGDNGIAPQLQLNSSDAVHCNTILWTQGKHYTETQQFDARISTSDLCTASFDDTIQTPSVADGSYNNSSPNAMNLCQKDDLKDLTSTVVGESFNGDDHLGLQSISVCQPERSVEQVLSYWTLTPLDSSNTLPDTTKPPDPNITRTSNLLMFQSNSASVLLPNSEIDGQSVVLLPSTSVGRDCNHDSPLTTPPLLSLPQRLIYSQSKITPQIINTSSLPVIHCNEIFKEKSVCSDSNNSHIIEDVYQDKLSQYNSICYSPSIFIANNDNIVSSNAASSHSTDNQNVEICGEVVDSNEHGISIKNCNSSIPSKKDKTLKNCTLVQKNVRESTKHREITMSVSDIYSGADGSCSSKQAQSNVGDAFDALFNSSRCPVETSIYSNSVAVSSSVDCADASCESAFMVPTNSQLLARANAAARRRCGEEDEARPTRFLMEESTSLVEGVWQYGPVATTLPQCATTAPRTRDHQTFPPPPPASIAVPISTPDVHLSANEAHNLSANVAASLPANTKESNDLLKSCFKRNVPSSSSPTQKRTKFPDREKPCQVTDRTGVRSESVIKQYGKFSKLGSNVSHYIQADGNTKCSSTLKPMPPADAAIDQAAPAAAREPPTPPGHVSIVNYYKIKPKFNSSSIGIVPAKAENFKAGSSSLPTKSEQFNHTKIIYEILKKYPNLVKDKKNLKLKIMRKNNADVEPRNNVDQFVVTSQVNLRNAPSHIPKIPTKVFTEQHSFKCSKCDIFRPSYSLLRQHVLRYHKSSSSSVLQEIEDKLFRCSFCLEHPKFFADKITLDVHNNEQHPNKSELRWCKVCGYKPSRKSDLVYHMYVKHKIEPPRSISFPRCDFCAFVAINQHELLKHRSSHPASDSYTCQTCSVTFRSFGALQGHLQTKACKQKQCVIHTCPHCAQTFSKSYNLKVHIRSQHKITPSKSENPVPIS